MPFDPTREIVDPHHHFFTGAPVHAWLASLGAPEYAPESYAEALGSLPVRHTVHVEALPDDPLAEARQVDAWASAGRRGADKVAAIVAACDLAAADAEAQLDALCSIARVRGIRYIVDWDGPFGEDNATHVACSRHGLDYLRDSAVAARFERGFALLASRRLSFDLQCCPAQLAAAAALFARHPGVPVALCHLGKPRHLAADGGARDEAKLAEWRAGMAALAALPHVFVKLSMLGYAVPGWCNDAAKEAFLKALVLEVIALFGARRCMFSSNYHVSAAGSDSDGASEHGLEPPPDLTDVPLHIVKTSNATFAHYGEMSGGQPWIVSSPDV